MNLIFNEFFYVYFFELIFFLFVVKKKVYWYLVVWVKVMINGFCFVLGYNIKLYIDFLFMFF